MFLQLPSCFSCLNYSFCFPSSPPLRGGFGGHGSDTTAEQRCSQQESKESHGGVTRRAGEQQSLAPSLCSCILAGLFGRHGSLVSPTVCLRAFSPVPGMQSWADVSGRTFWVRRNVPLGQLLVRLVGGFRISLMVLHQCINQACPHICFEWEGGCTGDVCWSCKLSGAMTFRMGFVNTVFADGVPQIAVKK